MTGDENKAERSRETDRFWMRPVSFAGLLRILHILAEYPAGLRAAEVSTIIRERKVYETERGAPSQTTLFHCRNTLLRLGAVRRSNLRYLLNREVAEVRTLLAHPFADGNIPAAAREAFAELVLANEDCRICFFDLFTDLRSYDADIFRRQGTGVTWKRATIEGRRRSVVRLEGTSGKSLLLSSPAQIKSILYGVRYWAREELGLVDEFFREDRGSIMYPIVDAVRKDISGAIDDVLGLVSDSQEWTTLSFADLAVSCCERGRRQIETLRGAIRELVGCHPGEVVLIPTSRAFATIRTRSPQREELELRTYYRDTQNRYISHLKIHRSVLEKRQCRAI